jgi:hypothetical protein
VGSERRSLYWQVRQSCQKLLLSALEHAFVIAPQPYEPRLVEPTGRAKVARAEIESRGGFGDLLKGFADAGDGFLGLSAQE